MKVLLWCNCTISLKVKNNEIKKSTFLSDIIRPLIVHNAHLNRFGFIVEQMIEPSDEVTEEEALR